MLDTVLFRSVVARERKRAERFEQPLVLMVISADSGADAATWRELSRNLLQAVRQTDVVGWVDEQRVLGVILPECSSGAAVVVEAIEARVREALATRMGRRPLSAFSIELHVPSRSAGHGAPEASGDPVVTALCAPRAARRAGDRLKRALDIVMSAVFIVLLAPLFFAIALCLKTRSSGPVLFRQTRVGQFARPFTMLKFRTMHAEADHSLHRAFVAQFIGADGWQMQVQPVLFKMADDPRVTTTGRFLRRTSLDELPQLWNVLRGDMSLVGPRPPLTYELENYQSWHLRRVLEAKPGLTGLWQVEGRSRTTFDAMVRMDLRYARTRSLRTDLKILLATPRAVFSCKGAC